MSAAKAVIPDGEEAIGIRGKVDADDGSLLVDHLIEETGILMGEAIVHLLPDVGGEEVIEGGDGRAPGEASGDLEPLGVLIEHGIHDVDEGLIAVEETVSTGEQITFEPALTLMLAEHLHDATVPGQELIGFEGLGLPLAMGDFEQGTEAIGEGDVGTEDAEVAMGLVEFDDVAEEHPEFVGVGGLDGTRGGDVNGVVTEVGEDEILDQASAIGVGIGAHATFPEGSESGEFREQSPLGIEEFLGPIAAEPGFDECEVLWMGGWIGERNLMGAEGAFDLEAIDDLGAGPALRRAEDDHGPLGTGGIAMGPGVLLDSPDLGDDDVEG
jgi:hypothetical protein